MAAFNVYSKNNVFRTILYASGNSTHQAAIQDESVLALSMTSQECVRLEPGDYVDFMDARFWILEAYTPKQISTVEWQYDVKFYGIEGIAKLALMLNSEEVPLEAYHGPAREQLAMVVMSLNHQMGTTDWKVGACVVTGSLDIDYSGGTYCNEALRKIAEAAGTEWWIEGTTINLTRCEHGEIIELGYNNGLLSIERDNADNVPFFTRLFPIGSRKNIEYGNYGHARLQLPNGVKFVERNADKYGAVARYEEAAFSHIFPRRIGYMSSIRTEQATGADGNPFTIYYFKDASLNFDPNDYKLETDPQKHIIFQTGDVAGRDFEVNYNSSTKEFEIITQWPYKNDVQVPGGLLVPKAGDAYILYNIKMPQEYYPMAEQEYAKAVTDFLNEHSDMTDRSVYKSPTNYIALDNRGITLTIGQRVRLVSDRFFPGTGYRDSRITRISRNVNRPNQADIEISDVLSKTTQSSMQDSIAAIRHEFKTATETFPDIIRSWESTKPTDTNIYSARKSEREFLHKNLPDTAAELIKFLRGSEFGQFFPGIEIGSGGAIDREGNAELQSLIIRSFLKVPQLIYNKVSVTGGEMWNTEGAVIKSVTADGNNAYILELEIEEGDHIELQVDDICKGHYNSSGGFVTSYFRVTNVNDTANTIRIVMGANSEVPGGINHPPVPYMNIARYGSFTVRERQRSQYFSSTEGYIVLLDFVDNYKIEPRHYRATFGNIPPSLLPDNLPINKNDAGIYLKNVIAENFFQIDAQGNPLKIIRDRGLWTENPPEPYLCNAQYQDEVYCDSCKYRCINEGTTQRPAYNSTDWLLVAGDTELTLTIYSTNGETFLQGRMDTTLIAVVKRGVTNITATILPVDWKWTRTTGNVVSDTIWNNTHSGNAESVHITDADMNGVSGVFTCEAYVRDGNLLLTESISF